MTCRTLFSIMASLLFQSISAQQAPDSLSTLTERRFTAVPVESSTIRTTAIGAGALQLLDSYLSSEEYSGTALCFLSHTDRPMRNRRYRSLFVHQADAASLSNRADNANYIDATYQFRYAIHRTFPLRPQGLTIEAGGGVAALCGFTYKTISGNNPAQARLSLSLSPSAAITWQTHVKSRSLRLRYELAAPLGSLMFTPNYGQSYYEIFSRGDYDHNVACVPFWRVPSLWHQLGADIRVGGVMLHAGYLGDFRQSHVNGLRHHHYTHTLVIGITKYYTTKRLRP